MKAIHTLSVIVALFVSLVGTAMAAKPEINGSTAIKGYDPVAYFTTGSPTEGNKSITHKWKGAEWRFASTANRDKFVKEPEKYAPQFGGYCAWAVSEGKTASINPKSWKIVNGKLYLNYSSRIQKRWEKDIPGHISKAEANWPKVLD